MNNYSDYNEFRGVTTNFTNYFYLEEVGWYSLGFQPQVREW